MLGEINNYKKCGFENDTSVVLVLKCLNEEMLIA